MLKVLRLLGIVLMGSVIGQNSLLARQAQTGSISGVVMDPSGRAVLVGAQVRAEGTRITGTTDASGRYKLLGVPVGEVKVTVSYLGLESSTHVVPVTGDATASLDFELATAEVSAQVTVMSSPELAGQARALNDQKSSINAVNFVASDQISSFPDPNAAEATQRIPGIVVQRDQGEGRYVLIRGTEPRLSATLINGERIGTTENTSRQIPLDTIPADLMGAIEVTKTLTPDMEADSIGGRINLITKRAPAARHISLTLGSGYNTLVDRNLKDYSGTFGQRFLQNKLGILVSGNFYENNRGSQDLEPAYASNQSLNSLDIRDYVLTRTRKGGTFDIDYQLGPGSELFFRGLRSRYEDAELRHRFRDLLSNGRLERALRNRYHDSNQTALSTGGTHALPNAWLVSWSAAFSQATLDTPYRIESTFRQNGVTFAPNVTSTDIDSSNIQANPQNQNLNSFNFTGNAIQNDRGYEKNLSGGANVAAPTRFGDRVAGLLKFGFKVRAANRTREVESISQTSGTTLRLIDYTKADYSPADGLLDGKYAEFGSAFPDAESMLTLSKGGTLNTVVSPTGDSGNYRARERVTSAYLMNEIHIGEHTTVLPGVRMESTHTTYGAPQYTMSGSTILSRTFFTGTHDYTNVLPGIHFKHDVARDTPIRIAFSRTLARPNYNDLAPAVLQDSTALTIARGNPELEVTTSNNVDVSIEHYFQNIGVVSAGFFYKGLDDYIYAATVTETIGTDLYTVKTPVNGEKASVRGLELALVRRFDFLPGPLDGFSLYVNYTHTSSNAILPRGEFVLPGQASNMGNVALSYTKKGFFARLAFNHQGKYIMTVGNTAAEDTWLDDRTEVDLSVSQKIYKGVRVFLDALNLGNDPYRVYTGQARYVTQEERYKVWMITGLKVDF